MKIIGKSIDLNASPVLSSREIKSYFDADLKSAEKELDVLTQDQIREVLDFWNAYTVLDSAGWAAFYTKRTGVFDVRYVPYDLFYGEIDRLLNNPYRAFGLDDKLMYYEYFPKSVMPRLIAFKACGNYYDGDHRVIPLEKLIGLCCGEGDIVLKPGIFSCGGIGVSILHLPEDEALLTELLDKYTDCIIQSKIIQHPSLAVFHPRSVNTVRALTYLRENGEVVVLSSVLRMGSGEKNVDNHNAGGCSCGICDDGSLRGFGFSNDGFIIKQYPDGVSFSGRTVPSYDKMTELIKELHYRLPQFAMLAWDLSVNAQGEPILIEINIGRPSIDFMQLNNGPLFGDYTAEVLRRVYRYPLKR